MAHIDEECVFEELDRDIEFEEIISETNKLKKDKATCLDCILKENRKEGNCQELIQLPNTFRPRHQRESRTH